VEGGIWFFQLKKSDNDSQWHNHLHCLLDSRYYPQGELSKNWADVTGGSYVVDIRIIRDPGKAANDAARYAACPADFSKTALDDNVAVYHALHGRRLCGTFGSAKHVPLKPPKDEHPELWENIGGRGTVLALRNSDSAARAIFSAYQNGVPLAAGVTVSFVDHEIDYLQSFNRVLKGFGNATMSLADPLR